MALERTLGSVGGVLATLGRGRMVPGVTLLMLAASFAEVLSIASIAPFVGYVATGQIGNPVLRDIVTAVPSVSPLVALGALSFAALVVGNAFQAATTYAILLLTARAGETLSARIFERLLARPFTDFLATNSSEHLTGLLHNVTSTVNNVLIPLLATIARLVSTLAILLLLVVISPLVAALAFLVASLTYVFAYRVLAPRIARHGLQAYELRVRMQQTAAEAIEAIREIKVFSSEPYFASRFNVLSAASGLADAHSQMMRQLPRYVIETMAFGGMIAIVIALTTTVGDSAQIWPLLALYAVAAWRLLPAAQQVFTNMTSIRHHWPALESLNRALAATDERMPERSAAAATSPDGEQLSGAAMATPGTPVLTLRDVTYTYPGAADPVLRGIDLTVAHGEIVGIVGRSGGGKTTLLALCLGLLEPRSGAVLLGGRTPRAALGDRRIAYVPQHPAFQDDSLRRNVAFGRADGEIDDARVHAVLEAVRLGDHVAGLADGLDTRIGERGQGLSGGQRQRLALARALYADPDLLVLDEFTSALDTATERALLDTLAVVLPGKTALVVTHRSEVLGLCHRVVEM